MTQDTPMTQEQINAVIRKREYAVKAFYKDMFWWCLFFNTFPCIAIGFAAPTGVQAIETIIAYIAFPIAWFEIIMVRPDIFAVAFGIFLFIALFGYIWTFNNSMYAMAYNQQVEAIIRSNPHFHIRDVQEIAADNVSMGIYPNSDEYYSIYARPVHLACIWSRMGIVYFGLIYPFIITLGLLAVLNFLPE